MNLRKPIAFLAVVLSVFPGRTEAAQTVTRPFEGVSHTDRSESTPRVVNVPVGVEDVPGSMRPVGSNLAVLARPL